MTRKQKNEALTQTLFREAGIPKSQDETLELIKATILAGLALRDAELLEVEFNKGECRKMAQASCDEEGYWQHEANIYVQGYKHGAGQKHEQFIKAIKGEK